MILIFQIVLSDVFWVKPKGLPLVKAFCLSYHVFTFFVYFQNNFQKTRNYQRTESSKLLCILKQFNIYMFKSLPCYVIFKICRTLNVEEHELLLLRCLFLFFRILREGWRRGLCIFPFCEIILTLYL